MMSFASSYPIPPAGEMSRTSRGWDDERALRDGAARKPEKFSGLAEIEKGSCATPSRNPGNQPEFCTISMAASPVVALIQTAQPYARYGSWGARRRCREWRG